MSQRRAIQVAVEKLETYGDLLGFPHTSNVSGADRLRELRPRAERSPWRAFYRRVGGLLVIAAVGPEASIDMRGFRAAARYAEVRLDEIERGEIEL